MEMTKEQAISKIEELKDYIKDIEVVEEQIVSRYNSSQVLFIYTGELKSANLEDADLEGANLKYANLEDADLEGANLKNADLEGVNLKGANLKGANLEGADLKYAILEGADLEGADLTGAQCSGVRITLFSYKKKQLLQMVEGL